MITKIIDAALGNRAVVMVLVAVLIGLGVMSMNKLPFDADPDISPLDATVQIPMIAKATGVAPSALQALITRESHGAQWGFMGASYIDVLQLNEALAKLH